MKVLVTGGAGFIGSHIADALLDRGYEAVIVDDLSSGTEGYINPKARFYKVDIRSSALSDVFAKEKPEVVNHHAARTRVAHSLSEPLDDAAVNVLGSLNLLQNCVKWGVSKFIYASSGGAIYGEPKYLPCDEDHPVAPLSPYGVSKHIVEHYLYLYGVNYGLDYTILRYVNVYGARQNPFGEAAVIPVFIYHMLKGLDITIYGSGEQERDFVHVKDIVKANLLTMVKGSGRIYNLGSGKGISINKLFLALKSLTGYRKEPIYTPPRIGEVFKICLDARRAKKELGWIPNTDLEKGLAFTLDFYKKLTNPMEPNDA